MEKKFTRSKIIIFSIAILVAILTFSIGIFGIIELNKKEKESQAADTHNYLLKKDTYYDLSWSGFNLKVIMSDAYKITYRKYNTEKQWYDSILIINFRSSATLLADGTKYGDYNVGGYYDITNTTFSSCEVINNDGLSLFNAFKSNGSAVIPCRHTLTGTWLGAGWADKDEQINYSKFSITQYHLNGTIDISVDGITYNKSYHWAMGLTYTRAKKEILTCGQFNNYIYTNEGLKLFAYELADEVCLNNDSFIYAKMYLADDLDMLSISNMKPIGTSSRPFCGTFNGNGHTIRNLTLCKIYNYRKSWGTEYYENYIGMFAYINDATIQNIYFDNIKWNNTMGSSRDGLYSGIVIARAKGNSTIKNCYIYDSELKIYDNGSFYSSNARSSVGSFVGRVDNDSTINIYNCGALVNIDSKGIVNIGGYVGSLGSNSVGNIKNSYYKGDIYGDVVDQHTDYNDQAIDIYFGGLIGGGYSALNAENCYVVLYNVSMCNGTYFEVDSETYDEYAGDYKYSEYSSNLLTNKNNYIYVKNPILMAFTGGGLSAKYGEKSLTRQVYLLDKEIF